MNIIENPKRDRWSELLKRPTEATDAIETTVNQIFDDVNRNGDLAISKYTQLFDGVNLKEIIVSEKEINQAAQIVSSELKAAIQQAKYNIEKFHSAQKKHKK